MIAQKACTVKCNESATITVRLRSLKNTTVLFSDEYLAILYTWAGIVVTRCLLGHFLVNKPRAVFSPMLCWLSDGGDFLAYSSSTGSAAPLRFSILPFTVH